MSNEFEKTELNQVKRVAKRGSYDRDTIYNIVDAALICHVGYIYEDQPIIIPTLHARDGDRILLHGSQASRMLRVLEKGAPVCITVTHVDGIVLARSIFNHSINYRSAVLFGHGEQIVGETEQYAALEAFTNKLMPGRWDDSRPPNKQEMLQTTIVAINIESASAKVRTGPPGDESADIALPHWSGVLPVEQTYGTPIPAPNLAAGIELPEYLKAFMRN
jgi:hypothetical protein